MQSGGWFVIRVAVRVAVRVRLDRSDKGGRVGWYVQNPGGLNVNEGLGVTGNAAELESKGVWPHKCGDGCDDGKDVDVWGQKLDVLVRSEDNVVRDRACQENNNAFRGDEMLGYLKDTCGCEACGAVPRQVFRSTACFRC